MSSRDGGAVTDTEYEEGPYDMVVDMKQPRALSATSKLLPFSSVDDLPKAPGLPSPAPVLPPPRAVTYLNQLIHKNVRHVWIISIIVLLFCMVTLGVVSFLVQQLDNLRLQNEELKNSLQELGKNSAKSNQNLNILEKIDDLEKKLSHRLHLVRQDVANVNDQIEELTNVSHTKVQCFKVVHDKIDWFQADQKCHEIGAFLAEIHDIETLDFVKQFVMSAAGSYWLGATDTEVEGEWVWKTSGHKMEIRDWLKDEPTGGQEDCLMMKSGGMCDESCKAKKSFVCYYIGEGKCPDNSWFMKSTISL